MGEYFKKNMLSFTIKQQITLTNFSVPKSTTFGTVLYSITVLYNNVVSRVLLESYFNLIIGI